MAWEQLAPSVAVGVVMGRISIHARSGRRDAHLGWSRGEWVFIIIIIIINGGTVKLEYEAHLGIKRFDDFGVCSFVRPSRAHKVSVRP